MARMTQKDWHLSAKERFSKAVGDESTRMMREKVIEAIRFARISGAQWEGSTFAGTDLAESMDKYPRFELNKVAREVDRIISEYRRNKITVKFRPSDEYTSVELCEKLNKAFRADWIRSNGDFAAINCFDDAVTGGMGAIEICAEYADPEDPTNKQLRPMFKPVYDTQSCIFWDGAAKTYDKSDAMWCGLAYTMTPDDFRAEYDKEPASVQKIETGIWNDWVTQDAVTVCKWFEIRIEKVEAIAFFNPLTQEKAVYLSDEIEPVIDELAESGFYEVERRTIKKRRVYSGIFDADGWLEPPKKIAGEYIPIAMQYGKRYFIDNQERIEGHVAKAMDAQRLDNLMVSMLADAATLGSENTPVLDVEQVQGLEPHWANRNKKRPAYLPLRSVKDKQGNVIQPAAIASYTQPAQVSPALMTLMEYAGRNIQEITGAANIQNLPSNLAEDTVESIFARADMQSFIYMDNAAMTMRYVGKVWLSMAKEIYGADVSVAMEDEEGNRTFGTLSGSIKDRQTGEIVTLNDITQGKFDVDVDVGESFASRRDATRRELMNLMQTTPPDSPYYSVIMSMVIANTDGEGVEDLQRYNRKQMIKQGVTKPEDEDAELMQELQAEMQQQQAPVDGNVLLAQAEMQKAAVAEQKNQMEYQKFLMQYELDRARLELEAAKIGADVRLKDAQSFKYTQEATSGIRESIQSTLQIRQ